MIIKTITKFVIGSAMVLVIFAGGFILSSASQKPDEVRVPVYIEQPPQEATIVEKTHFRDSLIENITAKQELITLEVDLSEEIVLDDTWINLDIFKKNQRIIYKGVGLFTVDLSEINGDSILVDDGRKIVQVKLSPPSVKSVQIDENRTEYFTVENAIFRSSKEVKLTSSEQQTLMLQVKSTMLEKMNEVELLSSAEDSARESISSLFGAILNELDAGDYTLEVIFV